MNAYMSCCCNDVGCDEETCPRVGLFICGTYTVSYSAITEAILDSNPCCGLEGTKDETKTRSSNVYIHLNFKAFLTNTYSTELNGYTNDFELRNIKVSANYVANANSNVSLYFDNDAGCPGQVPTLIQKTTAFRQLTTANQEDALVPNISMDLRTVFLDCNDQSTFSVDSCFYRETGSPICLQIFEMSFRVKRFAEMVLDSYEYFEQNGQVLIDQNTSSVDELFAETPWHVRFAKEVVPGTGCEITRPFYGRIFDYNNIQPCSKAWFPNQCECDESPIDECWSADGVGLFAPPKKNSYFEAGVWPVSVQPLVNQCDFLMNGNGGAKQTSTSASGFVGCDGSGTCQDFSGPPDGSNTSYSYNDEINFTHDLRFEKWEIIPFAEWPPNNDNWDDGLSCV